MLYFSSLLQISPTYKPAADRLSAALDLFNIKYKFINNTKDIWLRDFMPVKPKSGEFVSFRYEPSYLADDPELRTDYKQDISKQIDLSVIYSNINLDGGNVVFSPSKEKVIISDRVYSENPEYSKPHLMRELERLLKARAIIIPSLSPWCDMTGHADGMVRFIDENTAAVNQTLTKNGLEQRIKTVLQNHGIDTVDFPYFSSPKRSAAGCYLNYLETEKVIFLPVFGVETDNQAISAAEKLFKRQIVPVNINEIAKDGGLLNCIGWED